MSLWAAAGASVLGGLFSSNSASKAAAAQVRAAERQIQYQEETRDQIIERVDPFYQSGLQADQIRNHLLGMGPAPTIGGSPASVTVIPGETTTNGFSYVPDQDRNGEFIMRQVANEVVSPERYSVNGQIFDTREQADTYAAANPTGGYEYQGFEASPGYQYQFDQGMAAINALAGASGGLDSGSTMQALQDRGTQLANQDWYNYLGQINGVANQGLGAASLQATANTNAATGVSNALGNIGNAQSAAATAQGNIFSNTLNDLSGLWQYHRTAA